MKRSAFFALLLLIFISSKLSAQGIDKPQYQIVTHRAGVYLGTFNIELFPLIAPMAVSNFDSLNNVQFFDSTAFHRIVPGFVIQGGDPNSIHGPISTWGQGQPWQPNVNAEFSVVRHERGILGAARDADPNSANSQFYICVAPATFLDGNYTVYGRVTSGMDVVDTIVTQPRDVNDVPLQKIEMFITRIADNPSVPAAPTLTSPADGTTGVLNTQVFTWSAVDSAVLYRIEFSEDSTFTVVGMAGNTGVNASGQSALQGSKKYYWRVRSNNGGHESGYSNVYSFYTATAAANLIYPPDSATSISLNPVFAWSAVAGADNYTLQVSVAATFTTANMIYNVAGLTDTVQQVNGLLPNKIYYWRVRSANGTVQGYYSPKYFFTTGATAITELPGELSFYLGNIQPNPSADFTSVQIVSQQTELMQLSICDVNGRKIRSMELLLLPGEQLVPLDLQGIGSGIYMLSAVVNGSEQLKKFMVKE